MIHLYICTSDPYIWVKQGGAIRFLVTILMEPRFMYFGGWISKSNVSVFGMKNKRGCFQLGWQSTQKPRLDYNFSKKKEGSMSPLFGFVLDYVLAE